LPANRHSFTDNPLPTEIVVDSSFVFHALIEDGRSGYHIPARGFAERLRVGNATLIYSSLIFLEAPQCWKRLYNTGVLVPSQRGADLAGDRSSAFSEANAALQTFLSAFNRKEVRVTKSLMKSAAAHVAEFNLGSHDAIAIAISRTGVQDIAALDRGFKNVDGIELWDGLLT
jgi:predicted nucleic acid-binding protein